jgi:hypothetical protein
MLNAVLSVAQDAVALTVDQAANASTTRPITRTTLVIMIDNYRKSTMPLGFHRFTAQSAHTFLRKPHSIEVGIELKPSPSLTLITCMVSAPLLVPSKFRCPPLRVSNKSLCAFFLKTLLALGTVTILVSHGFVKLIERL